MMINIWVFVMTRFLPILLLCLSFNAFSADSSQVKALDRYVEIIDAEVKKHSAKPTGKLKSFYAESLDANARLLPVKKELPESAAMVYNVLIEGDNILYVSQFPISESGDWAARTAYYFSRDRKLRVLVSSVEMIDQDCALNGQHYQNIDRATSLYFDDDFGILKAMTQYSDVNGVPLDVKNKECSVPVYLPFNVYPTIGQLPEALLKAVSSQQAGNSKKQVELNATCLLVIDGATHMNSDCKLEKENHGSYFFDDKRIVITCPDGKNSTESNCSGYEMTVSKKGIFGMVDDESLCWNGGDSRKADYCFDGLKPKDNCWQSTKAKNRYDEKKTSSVKFCVVEK